MLNNLYYSCFWTFPIEISGTIADRPTRCYSIVSTVITKLLSAMLFKN